MISGGCVTTKVKRGLLNGYEFQIIMKWKKKKAVLWFFINKKLIEKADRKN